jgi:hypothetical protein
MGTNAGTGNAECQHATTSPTFPDAFGPNTVTNVVESCTLANCKVCSSTIDTCTMCKDSLGYYLGTDPSTGNPQCQHATISPTFPAGYGPDLIRKVVDTCVLANCKTCSANRNTYTVCKDDQGWFMGTNSGMA